MVKLTKRQDEILTQKFNNKDTFIVFEKDGFICAYPGNWDGEKGKFNFIRDDEGKILCFSRQLESFFNGSPDFLDALLCFVINNIKFEIFIANVWVFHKPAEGSLSFFHSYALEDLKAETVVPYKSAA